MTSHDPGVLSDQLFTALRALGPRAPDIAFP